MKCFASVCLFEKLFKLISQGFTDLIQFSRRKKFIIIFLNLTLVKEVILQVFSATSIINYWLHAPFTKPRYYMAFLIQMFDDCRAMVHQMACRVSISWYTLVSRPSHFEWEWLGNNEYMQFTTYDSRCNIHTLSMGRSLPIPGKHLTPYHPLVSVAK